MYICTLLPVCKLLHSFALEGAFGSGAGKSFGTSGKFSPKNWSIIKMLYFIRFTNLLNRIIEMFGVENEIALPSSAISAKVINMF